MLKTYVYSKCFEMFKGHAIPGQFTSFETEQGMLLEDEARDYYQLESGNDVRRVGFVESSDRRCGCSPDGIVGEDGGVEIKCPQPTTMTKYLIENRLPLDYVAQVHGSLYVTGRAWWDFFAYSKALPAFLIRIHRNEEIMAKIHAALDEYYESFNTAYAKLKARG